MLDQVQTHHHPDEGLSYITENRPCPMTSQRKFQFLADQMAEPVIEWNSSLVITSLNQAARAWVHPTGTDWVGQSLLNLIATPDQFELMKQQLSSTGSGWITCSANQGQSAYWSWLILRDSASRVDGGIAIIAGGGPVPELTQHQLVEDALRKSEARYRSLIAATAQSVWITGADGRVTEDQPSWRALTGQTWDEIRGFGWFEAIHPEDREQIQQAWAYALETKSLLSIEHRVRIASGEYRYFAVRAVPITDEAGNVSEWVGTHTDITDQKRISDDLKKAETQLRHSQRMEAVGRLAGGVAHDFNNLLMVISGYADLAANKLGKTHSLYRFLEEIRQASRSASGVTRQLLAFSRKQDQQLKSLNLTEVVTQLHKLLGRVIGEDIQLITSLANDTALVLADPTQIEQVVLNLVVNARDAMPTGGTLTLQTKNVIQTTEVRTLHFTVPPGNYVALIVTDTGCGMDEAILDRIYEPFFTTKEAHKGTGLGLSTVYGIVQQSNGYILVESQPGRGTTFTVLLPQTPGFECQPVTEEPGIQADLSNTTVLVVEDEDSVRTMVREVLTLWGYHVLEATSGESAIKLIDQHHATISLVLTDVVMSGMSGVNLVQHIQEKYPALKVLFMSGYIADASQAVGVVSQLDNFISKPFTPLVLVKAIQGVLNQPVDS